MSVKDTELARVYSSLGQRYARDTRDSVDDAALLDILAAVGDDVGWNFKQTRDALLNASSRRELLAWVKEGLSAEEKADIRFILDKGNVPLLPHARNFLEAVIGRKALGATTLQVLGDQKDGLAGYARPGDNIEVRNLSSGVAVDSLTKDTVTIGRADRRGRFDGYLAGLSQGDYFQVRARGSQGATHWVTVRANGLDARDKRGAEVALFRLKAKSRGGAVEINASGRLSEPNARLKLVNERTGDSATVQVDSQGRLSAKVTLPGKNGDAIRVAASDGASNVRLAKSAGTIIVGARANTNATDIPDPALYKGDIRKDGRPKAKLLRFTGRLFSGRVSADDVVQGYLNNCYMPAALSAAAHARPNDIKRMVRDNGDKTFTVTFKSWDDNAQEFGNVHVTVDADLYANKKGPFYGGAGNSTDPKKVELWYPIIEKAYAQWKGSYHAIGKGGWIESVLEDTLGMWASSSKVDARNPDATWKALRSAVAEKRPACLATYGEKKKKMYRRTGIEPDHCYTVLDTSVRNGKRMVKIRNPWGVGEPKGNGKDDGIFWMKLDDVMKLFEVFTTARKPK